MNGIEVKGRGIKHPVVNAKYNASGAVIRVDDAANPEFWFEVFIPDDALTALVNDVDDAKEDAEAAERAND